MAKETGIWIFWDLDLLGFGSLGFGSLLIPPDSLSEESLDWSTYAVALCALREILKQRKSIPHAETLHITDYRRRPCSDQYGIRPVASIDRYGVAEHAVADLTRELCVCRWRHWRLPIGHERNKFHQFQLGQRFSRTNKRVHLRRLVHLHMHKPGCLSQRQQWCDVDFQERRHDEYAYKRHHPSSVAPLCCWTDGCFSFGQPRRQLGCCGDGGS